jgi:hypothetical protein
MLCPLRSSLGADDADADGCKRTHRTRCESTLRFCMWAPCNLFPSSMTRVSGEKLASGIFEMGAQRASGACGT